MELLSFIARGMVLGLSAAASPGPFQAFLIAQSARLGWRKALPLALTPLISDGPIIALTMLALTRLPDGFLRVLQIGGSLYVLFLAWKSYQVYRSYQASVPGETGVGRRNIFQAALINLLSPAPYIFWSVLSGPVMLTGWKMQPAYGIGFVAGMYGLLVGGTAVLIILFGTAGQIGPRVNRALLGISTLGLLAFGVYQLYQGIFSGVSYM